MKHLIEYLQARHITMTQSLYGNVDINTHQKADEIKDLYQYDEQEMFMVFHQFCRDRGIEPIIPNVELHGYDNPMNIEIRYWSEEGEYDWYIIEEEELDETA